ncbi:unnamed protein product [Dicrocoelium dendriticum]|nr:unnamed protein product [Dicrocoelium dendriticum]
MDLVNHARIKAKHLCEQCWRQWDRSGAQFPVGGDPSQEKLLELESDLCECQTRLLDLVNAVCLTTAQAARSMTMIDSDNQQQDSNVFLEVISTSDMERVLMIAEETRGMIQTIPDQERFIERTILEVEFAPHLKWNVLSVKNLWQTYQEKLTCFEKFITSLEHGFKLLSQIKKFAVQKDVYFNNLEAHQTRLPELQAEGHRIEQAILTLVDPDRLCPLAERVESLLEVKPRVGWLVLRLQTALKEIRNDIDEADMLFSNLRACGSVGKVTPKRSQSDSFHRVSGIPRELSAQSLRTSSPLSPNGVPSMSSLDDSKRLDVQDLAVLESTPPPLPPRATTALFQTSDGASGRSRRTESSQASNGWETKSFDSIPAAWRITHPLRDLRVNTGERLSLTCQFTGPSGQNSFSTKWIFRPFVYALGGEADLGPEVDILATDNSVSQENGLDYARLLFRSIVPKLAGMYSVHIVSSATGRELTCSARVHVLPHLLSPLANLTVATADAQTGRLEPVAFTVAYRGFTQIPHALWTHAGHPVDSTIWRMSTNLDSSTIFSSVAERSSQGQYECRLHDPQTGFELCSSGILSVCDQLEFIEPLHPQRVVNGQPFRLSCRISCPEGYCLCSSADFEHTSETPEPRVLWLLNGHELTALDSTRLGITTEVDGDILTLNVPNARPQHSGLYQCEVKVGNVTARTQCKVVVEDAVAPKILACSVEPPGTVFEGQTVNISVRFEGHPLPSCSWMKDDKPVVVNEAHWEGCKLTICADRCTFMIPHVRLEHTGVYQVTLSNCLGTDVASAMLLLAASSSSRRPSSSTTLSGKNLSTRTDVHTLDPIPNLILLHPKCAVASVGERVRFVCIIDASSGPASVGWSHDGRNLTSQAGCRIFNNHPREGIFHLELECVQERDAGDYCANAVRVDAKHGTGSNEQSEFELKLFESSTLEFPPKAPYCDDATPHSIIRVVSGESVTLSFSVYAYPEPEFCWIRNKKEMVGHSCERYKITHKGILYCLTIENVSLKDSGLWELVCYNSAGVLISSNQLEVISPVSEKSGGSARSVTTKLMESTVFLPDSSSTPADASMALASSTSSTTLSERKALVSHPISVDTGGTQPPEFKSVFTDITCRTGDTVRLTARLTGSPSPLVCWAFNGESIQNTNDRYRVLHHGEVYSLWIEDVRVTDSGRYSLTAENIVGLATCSALLFVSAGSINRPYSPLSDPGFCIHSADGAADGFAPERRLLRQHSGTQTPTHQRVALIRSISTSHLDDEFFELAYPYSDYAHCHRCSRRKRYVCNHQPIEQPRIKSAGSNVTGKRHRGVHGRIRGRISGLSGTESPWRFSRHGSEGSLVHICPSCHSIMKSRAAYEDGDSDDGCILSTHITERIYTCERNRNDNLSSSHSHMRARCGQPGDSLPDPLRYHHSSTQFRPSDPSPTRREIPIQFMNGNSSSYVQEQSHRERFSHDRVLPVAATRTRNLPVSTPISAPADPQFSTVESSDGEVNQ